MNNRINTIQRIAKKYFNIDNINESEHVELKTALEETFDCGHQHGARNSLHNSYSIGLSD